MCNDIIRQHGGEIRVDVDPGEGTNMIITLPLEPPDPNALEEEVEEAAPASDDD